MSEGVPFRDEQAVALTAAADDCIAALLRNLKAPVSMLLSGHVALQPGCYRACVAARVPARRRTVADGPDSGR